METGNTGKYFKYAIGEIVLVVIGILIALSINNWNENRKQNLKDIEFLNGLRSELIIDTTNLSNRKHEYLLRNKRMAQALESLDSIKNKDFAQFLKKIPRLDVKKDFLWKPVNTRISKKLA